MTCPSCKGVGFVPTPGVMKCLSVRKKESYSSFNRRYLICNNCGTRFLTEEKIERVQCVQGKLFDEQS